MEKYAYTPAPPIPPTPAGPPVEPADIIEVDTSLQGDMVSVNGYDQKRATACTEFNQMMVNGSGNVVTIKRLCRQIMINGDGNQITADGAMEFVFNGSENVLRYSRFLNGKRPTVIENREGNVIEKISKQQSDDKNLK
jgi:hypothetical protein